MIIPAFGDTPPAEAVRQAVEALAGGWPIAIPTDTVYGLAADPFATGASDRVFEAKRRPRDLNLPLLVDGMEQALSVSTAVPHVALALMDRFWPGALTLVIPVRPGLGADLGDDEATVGVRCPAHPVPLALCTAAGPLATTSANRHGRPTLTTAAEVAREFGDEVPVVLDAGTCTGEPSTVADCTGVEPKLLRKGRIPWSEVLAAASVA